MMEEQKVIMEWYQYLSDGNIANFINIVKSEYFLIASSVLTVASIVVMRTKTKLDDKVLAWFKRSVKK